MFHKRNRYCRVEPFPTTHVSWESNRIERLVQRKTSYVVLKVCKSGGRDRKKKQNRLAERNR